MKLVHGWWMNPLCPMVVALSLSGRGALVGHRIQHAGVADAEAIGPERLIAEAVIMKTNLDAGALAGRYAFLPIVIHGKKGSLMIDLTDEGDITLSVPALAALGVTLPGGDEPAAQTREGVTQELDSLGLDSIVEHHVPVRLLRQPEWGNVETPATFPPVIGVMGTRFLARYDVEYSFPAHRIRLYAMPPQPVAPEKAWLPPPLTPGDCGRMIDVPPGAAVWTAMELKLDGHPVVGALEMIAPPPKMNQDAFQTMGLTEQSPKVKPIPDDEVPTLFIMMGRTIKNQVEDVRMTVGTHTFWSGTVQVWSNLDVQSLLAPKTPVMLLNLNNISESVVFNSMSGHRVCVGTP